MYVFLPTTKPVWVHRAHLLTLLPFWLRHFSSWLMISEWCFTIHEDSYCQIVLKWRVRDSHCVRPVGWDSPSSALVSIWLTTPSASVAMAIAGHPPSQLNSHKHPLYNSLQKRTTLPSLRSLPTSLLGDGKFRMEEAKSRPRPFWTPQAHVPLYNT